MEEMQSVGFSEPLENRLLTLLQMIRRSVMERDALLEELQTLSAAPQVETEEEAAAVEQ